MERLTERIKSTYKSKINTDEKGIEALISKLGKYEDEEEQGLLIRLPCKPGSTVYTIINQRDSFDDTRYKIVSAVQFNLTMINDIGKTIFLKKEQADKLLSNMEKDIKL